MSEWPSGLQWLFQVRAALVTVLPTLAAALLGALLATWLQERRRLRREHLAAIKADVFRPLRREIEGFYLPLLSCEIGPISIEQAPVPGRDRAVHVGTLLTNPGRLQLSGARPTKTGELNQILYVDAKCRHYGRFFRRLELFRSEVDAYTRRWVAHAEQLSQTIAEQIGLPAMADADPLADSEWIDADSLAVFVVNCQLGVTQRSPCLGPEGRSIEVNGVTMVRALGEDRIQRSLKVLEGLVEILEPSRDLRREADPLRHLARYLLRELDRIGVSTTLPGRCRLVRL